MRRCVRCWAVLLLPNSCDSSSQGVCAVVVLEQWKGGEASADTVVVFRNEVRRMAMGVDRQVAAAKTAVNKKALQRQIEATDRQTDRFLHELSGLTDDEIRLVQHATQER